MFYRSHFQALKKRLEEPRRFIQVLMGPRQVGKTTLVNQLTAGLTVPFHSVSADAVPASNRVWLEQQWETARLMMTKEGTDEAVLVIDEIQKVGNWSETIKRLWDEDTKAKRRLKVLLLGSSRLLLQQGLTESLAGRFETTYMGHWSLAEMQEAFGWTAEQFAWFGGYPGSIELVADEERWKRYVQQALVETSIAKDILLLTRVDKPALLRRLFELGCLYSGQILSYTKIMGQLHDAGNTTTLSHYLGLLDTAGLLGGLEKYAKDVLRKRSSSPKFQVHNTALLSSQRPEKFADVRQQPAEWGRVVESAIGAHLLNRSIVDGFSVHYWRERAEEVDFVIERKGKAVAIEVKTNAKASTAGMASFQAQFKPHKVLLVGSGGLPWEDFLAMSPVELF